MDAQCDGRDERKEWEESREVGPLEQRIPRQCAWCLRLMNDNGEPIASRSLSKLYEATHGMCNECGVQWVADVMGMGEPGEYETMSARELLAQISLDATSSPLASL